MSGYLHLPPHFPKPWASSWGEDEYGLWMGLEIEGVQQLFRWIEPGDFLMGSPYYEAERDNDETQHKVTLTSGFWLADSAVTQAFWLTVMGGLNPARFTENTDNPVERVNWQDAQDFSEKLNRKMPGLDAKLPTEAQWEYACRAGTTGPFSFGEIITPEQVNYDGNFPNAPIEEGVYREKTVPVKSLPANPWGLYEMHGNVWEWCQDWYGEYSDEPVTDPTGPERGDFGVLGGGSWIINGRRCRSARRRRTEPGDRYEDIGFRLSLGH